MLEGREWGHPQMAKRCLAPSHNWVFGVDEIVQPKHASTPWCDHYVVQWSHDAVSIRFIVDFQQAHGRSCLVKAGLLLVQEAGCGNGPFRLPNRQLTPYSPL